MSPVLSFGIVALALSAISSTASASGIPAFARRYGVSCSTCHAPAPRLNATGEAFAANGFRFARDENPPDTIATGDPLLQLSRELPLAVRFDAYVTTLTRRNRGQVIADMQLPWTMKLLSGGNLSRDISYYIYFLLAERGDVGGLEDAYLQFNDVFGTGIDLIAGQFQVSDPLFKRELRLEYEDYHDYRVRVGTTAMDLTYDRGLMAFYSPREGTDVVFEIVSGQGLAAAGDQRQYDRDHWKNVALRLSQDIGPLRIGAFGYLGKETAESGTSRIRIFGPDLTLALGEMGELNVQALRRRDDDPFLGACSALDPCPGGLLEARRTEVDMGHAELVLWPAGAGGRLFFTGLVNYIDAGAPLISLRLGEQAGPTGYLERYRTGSVGVHYLMRRNLRVMTEGWWNFDDDQARVAAGVITAF